MATSFGLAAACTDTDWTTVQVCFRGQMVERKLWLRTLLLRHGVANLASTVYDQGELGRAPGVRGPGAGGHAPVLDNEHPDM